MKWNFPTKFNQWQSEKKLRGLLEWHRNRGMGVRGIVGPDANDAARLMTEGSMSITSVQSYEMRIARSADKISDPPQPYWQTVELLLADRGVDHVARLLAYALRDLDRAQGKA